jgi:hypothetical protein
MELGNAIITAGDTTVFTVFFMLFRFGTLFAVGCNDGRIVVWDFLTRGIAKIIAGIIALALLKLFASVPDPEVFLYGSTDPDQRIRTSE